MAPSDQRRDDEARLADIDRWLAEALSESA